MSSSQQSANETAATGMIVVEPGQGTQMGPDLRLLGRAEWSGGDFMVIDQVVPRRRSPAPITTATRSQGVHALWNPGGTPARMLELTSSAAPFQELAPAATGAQAPAEPLGDA
jgi:hypothetical protein